MSTHSTPIPNAENPVFRSSNSELRLSALSLIPFNSPHSQLSDDYPLAHTSQSRKSRISSSTSNFDFYPYTLSL
ncbi:unnamed protein product [Meloidogyne enterolobii]|uniref:Uncharacterized protein n=1 Tax=Meloidogyne enterolobii TaxID=390850 RepID=A0ACB0Z715_MELEN